MNVNVRNQYEWIILPIDFHMFQDGYCTTNQMEVLVGNISINA